ncbi:cytochrome c [Altericroceibacterium spongiae]|uniref:Cytochrome c n=1 Tax=Altericroceibacterium spongiae TaxID=2320269 RepID=A0A420EPP8_9SPHN|nr:cytochrome c [Altericroceibacterium spongiae]RKF22640.1 cytochrome c [Altericroceibacterium spongiae]
MNATWKGAILGAAALLILMIVVALIVVLTGGYNVAATDRHNPIVGWALTTTMGNSVRRQATDIQPPAEFTPAMIAAGAGEYKAMCSHCHGGVGQSRAEWAEVMLPKPPPLAEAAKEWEPKEVFWLVKHGVKMSGMPAFGPTHDDKTIWNIVAFVKALPEMPAEQYAGYSSHHDEEMHDDHVHEESEAPHHH